MFRESRNFQRPKVGDVEEEKGRSSFLRPLPVYDPKNKTHVSGRYSRTIDNAKNRAFPNWARDPQSKEAQDMMKPGRELNSNYSEFTIPGVSRAEFLFYTGVKYKKIR